MKVSESVWVDRDRDGDRKWGQDPVDIKALGCVFVAHKACNTLWCYIR